MWVGVSYVELLILHELWAGERLVLEKAVPRYRRAGRSISERLFLLVQALIFRDLEGTLVRCFVLLLVCLAYCGLRHVGWEKCGHGLTSRPRESASEGFLDELLVLFGYPSGSAAALFGGSYPFGTVC